MFPLISTTVNWVDSISFYEEKDTKLSLLSTLFKFFINPPPFLFIFEKPKVEIARKLQNDNNHLDNPTHSSPLRYYFEPSGFLNKMGVTYEDDYHKF